MQEKETKTTIEFEVKVKTFDMTKGELIDAIAAGSILTKADAGREFENANAAIAEDTVEINFDPCLGRDDSGCGCPKISIKTTTKMTKADSGRA